MLCFLQPFFRCSHVPPSFRIASVGKTRLLTYGTFLAAALLAIGAGVLATIRLNEARHATTWVRHTHQVLDALHEIRSAVAAAEAAQHALIRALPEQQAEKHHARAATALQRGRELTRDNDIQQKRLDTLEQLVQERLSELSTTLALVQRGQADSARLTVRDDESEHRTDRIHNLLAQMTATEHELLGNRVSQHMAHADRGRLYVLIALGASVLLAALGAQLLRREQRRAQDHADVAETAASAARRSEARFRTALDAMLDAFYIARPVSDPSGHVEDFAVVEANEAGATLAGVAREGLLGAQITTFLPPDHAAALISTCARVMNTGERYIGEYSFSRPDAPLMWLRMQVVRAAEGVAITCQDITLHKRAEAVLADLAVRDELTGLLNRRGFRDLAEHEIKVARRGNRPDVLLSLDLTGFKQINDRYGHPEGDAALREVARLLKSTLREADVIARLGGDEFVVYAPGADTNGEAHLLVKRVADAFTTANATADTSGGRPYALLTGIGLALLESDDTLDTLLARADAALYAEKGRRTEERQLSQR